MLSILMINWADNLATSAITHLKSKVSEPAIGSLVYCDLVGGMFEECQHSGIYIGDGRIVGLNRTGAISSENGHGFTSGGLGWSIYVSCDNAGYPVGSKEIADRAMQKLTTTTDYNVLLNNCHQFSSGCVTGNFGNKNKLLTDVKTLAKLELNATEWRVWKRKVI